ncbi:MAG: hypothetical protein V1681_07230 [Candidatus Neomarinimicrobiota bacterium]
MLSGHNQKSRITLLALFLALVAILAMSCRECPTEPEKSHYIITLSVKETAPQYVRLYFSISDSGSVRQFELKQDSMVMISRNLIGKDTVVTISHLKPSTEYRYQLLVLDNDEVVDSSLSVNVTTPEASGDDFTWDVQTLGDYGSYLRDVWIVDENNIWVVGALVIDDSTALYSGQQNYNVAKWNGITWNYELIGAPGITGEGIFYFSENNIWVVTGIIYHWNGNEWERYHLWNMGVLDDDDGEVTAIWASSPSNIYFVGSNGSIVHFDGSMFSKMESGTEVDLTDIWGYVDDETGEEHIWAGGNIRYKSPSIVLYYHNGSWQKIYERYADRSCNLLGDSTLTPRCETVWTDPISEKIWIAGGEGLFTFDDIQSPTTYTEIKVWLATGYFAYPFKIRGNNPYDIFIAGESGSMFHYDGVKWKWYSELYNNNDRIYSLDITDSFICAVGYDYSSFQTKALIIFGHR